VKKIVCDPQELKMHEVIDGAHCDIHDRPPLYVIMELHQNKPVHDRLDTLDAKEVPIWPTTTRFKMSVYRTDGSTVQKSMQRTQLPLLPAYAITDFKSQGKSLPIVFVDFRPPPPHSGGYDPMSNYVAASRVRDVYNFYIMGEWHERMISREPPIHLKREMERLKQLEINTRKFLRAWKLLQHLQKLI
jgi:hypothetical protein